MAVEAEKVQLQLSKTKLLGKYMFDCYYGDTSSTSYGLPCIACMKTDGSLERNSRGTDVEMDSNRYDIAADTKAKVIAARLPNRSPNRPYNGPPANCTMANVV